jgi:VanZ family protein
MHGPSRLPLYIALSWAALAIYASLYPFAGWRATGADPLAFLGAAWPRYFTGFDLIANIAAYIPLGFFGLLAVCGGVGLSRRLGVILVTVFGVLLSGSLEALQTYLPSRVASNLDLACNGAGGLLGALLATLWGRGSFSVARVENIRRRWFATRRGVDSGLVLLVLWLVTQLDPGTIAFGTGDLRGLLELPPVEAFSAERFRAIETLVTASGLLAALLLTSLVAGRERLWWLPPILLGLALTLKTLAHALMLTPAGALSWATPGTLTGIAAAGLLWLLATPLPAALNQALAAMAMLIATAVVNLSPTNPYLENSLQVWNPGQFLNFHGLTQFIAAIWPYLALPWLMLIHTDRQQRRPA